MNHNTVPGNYGGLVEAATVMLRAKISGRLWWVWSLEMPAWQAWMKEEVGLRHRLPYRAIPLLGSSQFRWKKLHPSPRGSLQL